MVGSRMPGEEHSSASRLWKILQEAVQCRTCPVWDVLHSHVDIRQRQAWRRRRQRWWRWWRRRRHEQCAADGLSARWLDASVASRRNVAAGRTRRTAHRDSACPASERRCCAQPLWICPHHLDEHASHDYRRRLRAWVCADAHRNGRAV